jgi:hypothetical protein
MRSGWLVLLVVVVGCSDTTALPPADLAIPDLVAAVDAGADMAARDLAVPDLGMPDLARPDLAVPDLAMPDLVMPDLADVDAPPCNGGYLNGGGCPLGCSPKVKAIADEGAFHVAFCTPVPYVANPPASGMHWPWHADWGVAVEVIQREYWVHCLEHGGVVLLYNCPPSPDGGVVTPDSGVLPYACDGGTPPPPNSCAQDIATLAGFIQQQQPDQFGAIRILVTPDPKLPTKFAAVAWDWAWTGDNVDKAAIACFIKARLDYGPENAP